MTPLDVALEAAAAAAALLRSRPAQVHHKGAVDLVTEVDLACEAAIRDVLARHTPDVPVLGEEGGGATGGTRWVVDPLDGTTNFVHGFPYYAVSVALEVDGVREVGVVHDPCRGEVFAAARGRGATCNGAPIRVSSCADLSQALIGTGFPYDRQARADVYLRRVEAVLRRAQGIRRAGAAALDLAQVAAGRLDGFWEFHLRVWDVAAGLLLVTEAGGVVTGVDHDHPGDDPVHPLVAGPALHADLAALLRSAA
jgi:myo-inositol-1(or 4)-monophosphatase